MEVIATAALLLVAVALGAIGCLQVVRFTQESSASMQQYSKDVMSLAIEALADREAQITRDRSLAELAKQLEVLNLTVGQLWVQSRQAERTVLLKPIQHGEAPPEAPPMKLRRQTTLPNPGLVGTEKGSTPAADQVRATAFAEPT